MKVILPTAVFLLVFAAPAYAIDNGEGLLGETDDRIVTFISLGVVVFFVLVAIAHSSRRK